MSLEEPKGTEDFNEVYMLAPTALGGKIRGAEYDEASDPETEIWRALPEILHYRAAGEPVPAQVYIVDRTLKLLSERCFAVARSRTGVKCRQANTLKARPGRR